MVQSDATCQAIQVLISKSIFFQWITLAFDMWKRMTEISVPNLHFTKFLVKNTIVIALQIIALHWILFGLWGLRKNWTYQLSCFIAWKSKWFKRLHHGILLIPLLYCASQYRLLWQDVRWAESLSRSRAVSSQVKSVMSRGARVLQALLMVSVLMVSKV